LHRPDTWEDREDPADRPGERSAVSEGGVLKVERSWSNPCQFGQAFQHRVSNAGNRYHYTCMHRYLHRDALALLQGRRAASPGCPVERSETS
jgi:hypothetical protein